jgi:xanthine dehydrogenase accessory factor
MQSLDFEVLTLAREWLTSGHRMWLVTVTQTFGASPRPPGSLMAMRDDGILVGSVSGGCIEDDLVSRRESFRGAKPALESYGVTSEEARRFGLPCGGQLEVIVESAVTLDMLGAFFDKVQAGEVFARVVNLTDGTWAYRDASPTEEVTRTDVEFISVHGPKWRLLIIGASEIARYLAEMAGTLDFHVYVCDPREEYKTAWRVHDAVYLDGMPDDVVIAFRPDPHTVIVTVSHDPKLDDMALMEALKMPAFYVGAVGSQRTSDERRKRLQELDVSSADVAKLHGPVGLAIGSRTPPEIAIAILAELVAARNGVMLNRVAHKARNNSAA